MLYTPEELAYWDAYVTPQVRRHLCRLAAHNLRILTSQKWAATSRVHASAIGRKLLIRCKPAIGEPMMLELNWGDLRIGRLLRDDPLEIAENEALALMVCTHILRGVYLATPHGKRGQRVLAQLEAMVRRVRGK